MPLFVNSNNLFYIIFHYALHTLHPLAIFCFKYTWLCHASAHLYIKSHSQNSVYHPSQPPCLGKLPFFSQQRLNFTSLEKYFLVKCYVFYLCAPVTLWSSLWCTLGIDGNNVSPRDREKKRTSSGTIETGKQEPRQTGCLVLECKSENDSRGLCIHVHMETKGSCSNLLILFWTCFLYKKFLILLQSNVSI